MLEFDAVSLDWMITALQRMRKQFPGETPVVCIFTPSNAADTVLAPQDDPREAVSMFPVQKVFVGERSAELGGPMLILTSATIAAEMDAAAETGAIASESLSAVERRAAERELLEEQKVAALVENPRTERPADEKTAPRSKPPGGWSKWN